MSGRRVLNRIRACFLAGLCAAGAIVSSPAQAWGKTGHRVIAAIAQTKLSGLARARVEQILGPGESLDEASTWPDAMRSAPGEFWQKRASPWHFVTLRANSYDHPPPEGDAVSALARFKQALEDPKANLSDKQLALRFVVHLVADLHQPLHVGRCCDRGGNDVKVTWFGKPTNLHTVWDSELVDDEQLSFTELAAKLERHIKPEDVVRWWDANPLDWIAEGARIRDTLYPGVPAQSKSGEGTGGQASPPDLSYRYVYEFTPVMERQLSKAGLRLAAYLNAIFEQEQSLKAIGREK